MNKSMKQKDVLLEVKHLKKYFPIRAGFFRRKIGEVKAVNDISFFINRGETFGLVGESGSGKTTTGRTILRLEDATSGQIIFDGEDITKVKGRKLRNIRKNMQMIYQDPYASLNPQMMVGNIISEPLRNYGHDKNEDIEKTVKDLLVNVGLKKSDFYKYPHEFSGGQRQRIGIARAIALKPKLIIADEPVSALDVSIQAQVINLLKKLQKQYHLTYLFIAHDLAVVKYLSDRIGVMKDGNLVELTTSEELYKNPLHPYTKTLLSAVLTPDPYQERHRKRITYSRERSDTKETPILREISEGHFVRCTSREYERYRKEHSQNRHEP